MRHSFQSLERKLPLLITGLLLATVLAFAWATYRGLRTMSWAAAAERLERVARQLIAGTDLSNRERLREINGLTGDASILRLLRARRTPRDGASAVAGPDVPQASPGSGFRVALTYDVETEEAAMSALRRVADVVSLGGGVLLLDGFEDPVLAIGQLRDVGTDLSSLSDSPAGPETQGLIGELRRQGDAIFYEVWVPVRDGDDVIGYLGQQRVVNANPMSRELISGLIGKESVFLFGNADGSLWTDLAGEVSPPPETTFDSGAAVRFQRQGSWWLAQTGTLETVPWTMLVAFPESTVLAPARRMLWRIAAITLATLVVGVAGAWGMSRQIVVRLRDLTEAVEAIAAGDVSRRVRVQRRDELGELASSFNAMAAEVEEGRARLEEQVARRTRSLRRTAQELDQTRDELVRQERLAVLGALSSGLGHELRNPLGVMRNSVFLLQSAVLDVSPQVRRYLQVIDEQVTTCDQIIHDLLSFARVQPAETEAVSVVALIERAMRAFRDLDGVAVRLQVPSTLPPVRVDPDQIHEVLSNVIANAVEAMSAAGTLTFTASLEAPGDVALRIIDTGPGIPAGARATVFEPLYTTRARGIGLGLSVARRLARNNGGDLAVERSEGASGAVLVLRMPVAGDTTS